MRVKVALAACVENEWFTAEQAGGELRIKLGERALKVREGKEPKPQARDGTCGSACLLSITFLAGACGWF